MKSSAGLRKKKKNKLKNRHIMGIVKHTRGKKNYFYDNYVIKKKNVLLSENPQSGKIFINGM